MVILFLIYWLFCVGWVMNELSKGNKDLSEFEEFLVVVGSWAVFPLCIGKKFSERNISNSIKK